MGADEYYDAVGEVLSYVLSAEDFIIGQRTHKNGKYFIINRDNTNLEFFAEPNDRYFILIYQFSLTQVISDAYEQENQLLHGHLERYDIDDTDLGDENLHAKVAYERVKDVDQENAEKLISEIKSLAIHSDCRIQNKYRTNPRDKDEDETEKEEVWDGVSVAGLLYPYEGNFSPRDYEQVAQEVISVGNQIDQSMEKLDTMQEIGFEST